MLGGQGSGTLMSVCTCPFLLLIGFASLDSTSVFTIEFSNCILMDNCNFAIQMRKRSFFYFTVCSYNCCQHVMNFASL